MEIIQRFFQKKQGPSSVVVNGKTYTILKSLGEGGDLSRATYKATIIDTLDFFQASRLFI